MIEKDQFVETQREISAEPRPIEDVQDKAVRPKSLADYVGQPAVREQMEIFIEAAKGRGEALDHTLSPIPICSCRRKK